MLCKYFKAYHVGYFGSMTSYLQKRRHIFRSDHLKLFSNESVTTIRLLFNLNDCGGIYLQNHRLKYKIERQISTQQQFKELLTSSFIGANEGIHTRFVPYKLYLETNFFN